MTGAKRHRAAIGVASLLLACLAAPATAQLPADQQACLAAFGKAVRNVAKIEGKTASRCLKQFAAGRLVETTPEGCLLSDRAGRLLRTASLVATRAGAACTPPLPAFGMSAIETAMPRAGLGVVDLLHDAIGDDLDTALVPVHADALCQSQVTNALLKCVEARRRAFLTCERAGLADGAITDASTLQTRCLGTGNALQPDPDGRIALACGFKLATVVSRRCGGVDLSRAFPACRAADGTRLSSCLFGVSACHVCQLMNDVAGLSRDCDQFDDGDGSNGTCGAECADGILQRGEACDDGNTTDGDGCSSTCSVEAGWSCSGSPSVCTPTCGNGVVDDGEGCDDGNTTDGDGCSSDCHVEDGWGCSGAPSQCARKCGNGVVDAADDETCDDGNRTDGDGCSSTCQLEPGWACTGEPSFCSLTCGNGTFEADETCDDGNTINGDGCSAGCQVEQGWLCSGRPSHCTPRCGDGLIRGGETCDDGNATSGDGCSFICQPEAGWSCTGEPSNCTPVCGDGFLRGPETCDDHNNVSGDGCDGVLCRQEAGWTCVGQPSSCTRNCPNGQLESPEECDDGNHTNGDGCNASCRVETGWACGGEPSSCVQLCGNGVVNPPEGCDDGNHINGDGCSASCQTEAGWHCTPGQPCVPFTVSIDTPSHGVFSTAGSVMVTGHYTTLPVGTAAVKVNGEDADAVDPVARTFSHTLALDGAAVFNPVVVTLTDTGSGLHVQDRIVVIKGNSVADGAYSPRSTALRMNNSGLHAIEPLFASQAAGQFDIASAMPTGTVVLPWQCFFDFIWCWAGASASIGSPAPSVGGVRFSVASKPGVVGTTITLDNLRIDVAIDGTGLVPDCGLRLTADHVNISADLALQPDASNPRHVDVNQSSLNVSIDGFRQRFTYGACGLIAGLVPSQESLVSDGIKSFLVDPDGSGPADSPLAAGIQQALAGISIAGGVSEGVGLHLDAPFFQIAPDATGITLGADSSFTVSVGNGPGQCIPPPGAPDFAASYAPPSTFPSLGANAPVTGAPYGLGIGISAAGFNQLLRGQTECGLMRDSLTSIDLDGAGGAPPLNITSTLLSVLAPEFAKLPANTPLRIDITPTLAPIVTGGSGPNGEVADLRVAQMLIDIVQPSSGTVWLEAALDVRLGMNLSFLPDGSALAVNIAPPAATDMVLAVTYNPLGVDEARFAATLPAIIRPLVPELAGAFSGFPLPTFFGLGLQGVEVSRSGDFIALYANLVRVP